MEIIRERGNGKGDEEEGTSAQKMMMKRKGELKTTKAREQGYSGQKKVREERTEKRAGKEEDN